jgi:tetratricopeptide (TPR) repeat protein
MVVIGELKEPRAKGRLRRRNSNFMDIQRIQHMMELRDTGHPNEALLELEQLKATASDPDEKASVFLSEAGCYQQLGRLEEAWRCLDQARRASPRSELRMHIDFVDADLSWDGQRFQEAHKKLERLWKDYAKDLRDPNQRDLYEMVVLKRGILLAQGKRPGEAIPILREAVSFALDKKTHGDVCFNLGVCYFNLRDWEKAKEYFRVAAEQSSPEYMIKAHYYLGVIHTLDGAYARALQELVQVEPHMGAPGITRSKLYELMAKVCRELGQADDADRYEKQASG